MIDLMLFVSLSQVLETCDNGRQMIEEEYPQADNFQDKIDQLMAEWDDLKVWAADQWILTMFLQIEFPF